jgi:hypothetical protein
MPSSSPPAYRNRLHLELDDWLDPSLPRCYSFPLASSPFQLFDEFTSDNEEFRETLSFPAFVPVMQADGLSLLPPVCDVTRAYAAAGGRSI